jgi:hypothetical protein
MSLPIVPEVPANASPSNAARSRTKAETAKDNRQAKVAVNVAHVTNASAGAMTIALKVKVAVSVAIHRIARNAMTNPRRAFGAFGID